MSKGRRMRYSESNEEHVLLLRHWTSWDPVGFEIPVGILWDGSQFQYYNKTGTGQEKKTISVRARGGGLIDQFVGCTSGQVLYVNIPF